MTGDATMFLARRIHALGQRTNGERCPRWRAGEGRDWGIGERPAPPRPLRAATAATCASLLAPVERQRLRRAVRALGNVRLSFGSGPEPPPGWLGVDIGRPNETTFALDLRRSLPLDDASVSAVVIEHFLEHLLLDDAQWLLRECRRLLAPSGAVRVVSPDARIAARLLLDKTTPADDAYLMGDHEIHGWARDALSPARTANRLSHQWGHHKALLTPAIVEELLRRAGFAQVTRPTDNGSLLGAPPDLHARRFPRCAGETFVVEAR